MDNKTILCIDGDTNWVSNLNFQARNKGVIVEQVSTMVEAMGILDSSANVYYCIVINYSLIIQDADVSVLIDDIKEKVKYTRIVFLLNKMDERKIASISLTHANGYVVKPSSIEELLIQSEKKVIYNPTSSSIPNIKINGLSNIGIPQNNNSFQNQRGNASMSNMNGMNQQQGMNQMPNMGRNQQQGMNQMPNMGRNQQQGMNQMPNMNGRNQQQGMNQMPNMGRNQQQGMNQNPNMNGRNQQQGMNQTPNMRGNQQQGMNQNPNMGGNQQQGMNQMPNMRGNQQQGMNQMPNMNGGNQQQGMNQMPNMNGRNQQQGMNQNPNMGGNQQQGMGQMPNMRGNQQQGMNQNPNMGRNQQQGMNQNPNMGGNQQQGMNQNPNMGGNQQQGMNQNPNMDGINQGMGQMPNMGGMNQGMYGMDQHQNMNSRNAVRVPRNTVISVHCPKGGVGKSSISKELASIYSQCSLNGERLRVCIVDMDLDYADSAIMFGLKQNKSIADWARAVREQWTLRGDNSTDVGFSYEQIDSCYLLTHNSGLKILAGPKNHKDSALINTDMVTTIINNLRKYFDVIIIDTGNSVKDFTVRSLEVADKILMVCNSDLTTINEIMTLKKTLEQIQYPMHKISLLMNEVTKEDGTFPEETSSYLNLSLIGKLPKTIQIKQANNNCQILSLGPDTPFKIELKKVANAIIPVVKKGTGSKRGGLRGNNQDKKPGFFSRLFGKNK